MTRSHLPKSKSWAKRCFFVIGLVLFILGGSLTPLVALPSWVKINSGDYSASIHNYSIVSSGGSTTDQGDNRLIYGLNLFGSLWDLQSDFHLQVENRIVDNGIYGIDSVTLNIHNLPLDLPFLHGISELSVGDVRVNNTGDNFTNNLVMQEVGFFEPRATRRGLKLQGGKLHLIYPSGQHLALALGQSEYKSITTADRFHPQNILAASTYFPLFTSNSLRFSWFGIRDDINEIRRLDSFVGRTPSTGEATATPLTENLLFSVDTGWEIIPREWKVNAYYATSNYSKDLSTSARNVDAAWRLESTYQKPNLSILAEYQRKGPDFFSVKPAQLLTVSQGTLAFNDIASDTRDQNSEKLSAKLNYQPNTKTAIFSQLESSQYNLSDDPTRQKTTGFRGQGRVRWQEEGERPTVTLAYGTVSTVGNAAGGDAIDLRNQYLTLQAEKKIANFKLDGILSQTSFLDNATETNSRNNTSLGYRLSLSRLALFSRPVESFVSQTYSNVSSKESGSFNEFEKSLQSFTTLTYTPLSFLRFGANGTHRITDQVTSTGSYTRAAKFYQWGASSRFNFPKTYAVTLSTWPLMNEFTSTQDLTFALSKDWSGTGTFTSTQETKFVETTQVSLIKPFLKNIGLLTYAFQYTRNSQTTNTLNLHTWTSKILATYQLDLTRSLQIQYDLTRQEQDNSGAPPTKTDTNLWRLSFKEQFLKDPAEWVGAFRRFELGSIQGKVFLDLNANQLPDLDEPGLAHIGLAVDKGMKVATDATGWYHAKDLTPKEHLLSLIASSIPARYAVLDYDQLVKVKRSRTQVVHIPVLPYNTISGRIFFDMIDNHRYDKEERALAHVTLIAQEKDGKEVFTTSGADGRYSFDLLPGEYTIRIIEETLPPPFILASLKILRVRIEPNGNDADDFNFLVKKQLKKEKVAWR